MSSLSSMKEALKDSLTRQWDAQQQKKEQLAALTHDIKTPLTVIKGNAELLAETDLSAENWECTDAILANVGSMEQYLEHMRQLLYGRDRAEETEVVTCARLKEQFKEAAMQIAAAEKVPVVFRRIPCVGMYAASQDRLAERGKMWSAMRWNTQTGCAGSWCACRWKCMRGRSI